MASILVPVLYVALLIGSLLLFSRIYRKRLASQRKFDPWFPTHPERDLYVTLLQQSDPPASETLLKAALLRRAAADVARIFRIREDKQALQTLLQKGSVGDDLWNSCLTAEKELEAEILEVVGEANTFRQGWGQIIFSSATEIVASDKIREVLVGMPKVRAETELKYSTPKITVTSSSTPAVPPSTTPVSAQGSLDVSDGESAASTSPSTPSGTRKSANKKGKKRK